jgi:hypothetical protein
MVSLLARVTGIGVDTADLLVHEVLLRNMRDRCWPDPRSLILIRDVPLSGWRP